MHQYINKGYLKAIKQPQSLIFVVVHAGMKLTIMAEKYDLSAHVELCILFCNNGYIHSLFEPPKQAFNCSQSLLSQFSFSKTVKVCDLLLLSIKTLTKKNSCFTIYVKATMVTIGTDTWKSNGQQELV